MYGQELNATVTVNSDRIQSTNKDLFTSLEQELSQFINNTKWSSATFSNLEKIDCTFSIIISEEISDYNFKAELMVHARRPVYNSTYVTTTLNWRDTKFEFEFMQGTPLYKQDNNLSSNLIAVVCFYCNLVLGVDFDSFSPLGGGYFYREAQNIANTAQSSGWIGWSAFDDNKSRTAVINAFNDNTMQTYRQFWYLYHRKGLDEMAANSDRARTTILEALPTLKEVRNVRGSEIILQMFADCKLEEVASIAEKASSDEKRTTYDLLRNVFPASSDKYESLKK
jgi:hypothetical protein